MVEFVSYSGAYPNLCSGELVLKINGETVYFENALSSGGAVWFDDDWLEHVESGAWSVSIPEKYLEFKNEIEECINANIPWGCCGGCV